MENRVNTEATNPGISTDEFKTAFRNYPAGVAVLTAVADGEHVAMTVSSLFSISATPPLVGFSVSDMSSTAGVFNRAESVIIHMVDADSLWLAKLGAMSGAARFANAEQWSVLSTGERYFPAAPIVVRAAVVDRLRAGGSTLCVAEAMDLVKYRAVDELADLSPVVYHDRTWHRLDVNSALAG